MTAIQQKNLAKTYISLSRVIDELDNLREETEGEERAVISEAYDRVMEAMNELSNKIEF